MRYMIIVKGSAASEAGTWPEAALQARLASYHEDLARAGVLLDAHALQPSAAGWRLRHRGGQAALADGPFDDAASLIAGYTLIQVRSRDEALEWARRFPAPMGEFEDGEIELRPLVEPERPAAHP